MAGSQNVLASKAKANSRAFAHFLENQNRVAPRMIGFWRLPHKNEELIETRALHEGGKTLLTLPHPTLRVSPVTFRGIIPQQGIRLEFSQ